MARPATFSDNKHPLNPDDVQQAKGYRDEVLDGIRERLNELYDMAHTTNGLTKRGFAERCGAGMNKGGEWLERPETMSAEHVRAACELFGVTLEYLQCQTDMPDRKPDVWSKYEIADSYDRLPEEHKRLITSMMRELNKQTYYRDRMREYAPYAARALL